jgi:hypothetical protein
LRLFLCLSAVLTSHDSDDSDHFNQNAAPGTSLSQSSDDVILTNNSAGLQVSLLTKIGAESSARA